MSTPKKLDKALSRLRDSTCHRRLTEAVEDVIDEAMGRVGWQDTEALEAIKQSLEAHLKALDAAIRYLDKHAGGRERT